MTKNEELGYIGGIIDGEGSFSISKNGKINPCFYARLTIHMRDEAAIKLVADTFRAGRYYKGRIGGKRYFSFYISGQKLLPVIDIIMPYLLVKGNQAVIVRDLLRSRKNHRATPIFVDGRLKGNTKIPQPIQDYRASLFLKLKQSRYSGSTLPSTAKESIPRPRKLV